MVFPADKPYLQFFSTLIAIIQKTNQSRKFPSFGGVAKPGWLTQSTYNQLVGKYG